MSKRKPLINANDPEYKKVMREAKKEYEKWLATPKVRAFLTKVATAKELD